MSEVVLDEGGIELLWRVHFGFFDPVVAGNDTDGDGITDADEEKNWTDPRNKNEPDLKKSPEQRRQDVIEAMRSPEPIQAGKPATISEELALEYTANAGIRTRIAMSQAAAHARVEAWSKRTGNKRHHFRGGVVTDMEGDEPVVQYDNGIISNTSANVMPLWPGQSVQSNVTGYGLIGNPLAGYTMTRQICGMWEKHVPLDTHNELFGRVAWGDDARPGPDSSHATAVAGIIGASGTAGSTTIPNGLTFVHADFRGVAYQCEVRAYDLDLNYTELSALNPPPGGTGENLLKRMRASNHSYGPNYGWKGVDVNGIRLWDGSIEVLFPTAPNYVPEDYRFGLYNEDAQQADSTAYALPYRLLVRAAGNETGEGSMDGRFLSISINGGLFTNWWYSSFLGTGPNRSPVYVNSVLGLWVYANAVNPIMSGGVLIGGTVADPQNNIVNTGVNHEPGNDGYANPTFSDSLPGGFTVCKNALCVGALGDSDGALASYSGVGPTDDGRIKPDVVARGGEFIVDPTLPPRFPLLGSNGPADYNYRNTGTSFAAPAAAGAVTLLSEWQEKLRSNKEPFRASTFKALLCHTATDIGVTGPDFHTGWGRINVAAAAELIKTNDDRRNITEVFLPASNYSATAKLRAIGAGPSGNQPIAPIKVTIAWTDPPGNPQPNTIDPQNSTLKHNINLKLIKTQLPANLTVYPWKPNPANPGNPYLPVTPPTNPPPAGWYENNRDNVEQVYIPAPLYDEEWEIKITSSTPLTAGTTPGQWVSVVMEGLFNPSTVPDGTILGATVATQSTYVVFPTVMGGYYRLQCQPYGGPWINIDAPAGEGLIRARNTGLYTTWFGHNYGATSVPLRIVKLSPNPFNVP